MLFNNPILRNWYTDTMDVYRVESVRNGNIDSQERVKVNTSPIPCRIYEAQKKGLNTGNTVAGLTSEEKLSCDIDVDLKAGDELYVIRGGNIGMINEPDRYLAGKVHSYYDPIGGVMSGLQHKEVGLLLDTIVR